MITIQQIIKTTQSSVSGVTAHYSSLMDTMKRFDINTPRRIAAFISNIAYETNGFRAFIENLNYSEQGLLSVFPRRFTPEMAKIYARKPKDIANLVYGNRYGNTQPDDGWKYRGRGGFQVTFKDNYKLMSSALKVDFVMNPDLIMQPPYAMLTSGVFWNMHKLNSIADAGDILTVCRRINGGTNGLQKRIAIYENILREVSI